MSLTPLLDAYATALRNAAQLLAELKAVNLKREDLIAQLGITKNDATRF